MNATSNNVYNLLMYHRHYFSGYCSRRTWPSQAFFAAWTFVLLYRRIYCLPTLRLYALVTDSYNQFPTDPQTCCFGVCWFHFIQSLLLCWLVSCTLARHAYILLPRNGIACREQLTCKLTTVSWMWLFVSFPCSSAILYLLHRNSWAVGFFCLWPARAYWVSVWCL